MYRSETSSARRERVVAAARYLVYRAGYRHSPKLLRRVEKLGYQLRNRRLFNRTLCTGAPSAEGALRLQLVGWDEAFARDMQEILGSPGASVAVARHTGSPPRSRDLDPRRALQTDADVVMVEVPDWRAAEFAAEGYLILPKRVTHLETLDDEESPSARELRRAATRLGLSYDVTRSRRELEQFHAQLYLPMVLGRHRDRARPTSLDLLRLVLRDGWLLRVRDGARWVSGAVVARHPTRHDTISVIVTGVRDGDYAAVSDTARAASVLFSRDFARSQGARVCDHLVTRPFPLDGLFRRKRRWATVPGDLPERPDRIALAVRNDSAAVRRWLGAWPLLALSEDGLVGVAWGDVTADAVKALSIPGLAGCFVSSGAVDIGTKMHAIGRGANDLRGVARRLLR